MCGCVHQPVGYLIEEVLKLLIGQVDAELFKGIHFKVLKAKDIKNT